MLSEILGPDLLVVIIVAVLLMFGGAAIPKFARNLGQTKSEFEKGKKSVSLEGPDVHNSIIKDEKAPTARE